MTERNDCVIPLPCNVLLPSTLASPKPVQERIRSLIDMRKMLIDDNWAPGDIKGVPKRRDGDDAEANAMVEKERARLEVLKRRQEKDLQQVSQGSYSMLGIIAELQPGRYPSGLKYINTSHMSNNCLPLPVSFLPCLT